MSKALHESGANQATGTEAACCRWSAAQGPRVIKGDGARMRTHSFLGPSHTTHCCWARCGAPSAATDYAAHRRTTIATAATLVGAATAVLRAPLIVFVSTDNGLCHHLLSLRGTRHGGREREGGQRRGTESSARDGDKQRTRQASVAGQPFCPPLCASPLLCCCFLGLQPLPAPVPLPLRRCTQKRAQNHSSSSEQQTEATTTTGRRARHWKPSLPERPLSRRPRVPHSAPSLPPALSHHGARCGRLDGEGLSAKRAIQHHAKSVITSCEAPMASCSL
jgi:hypothetical protein